MGTRKSGCLAVVDWDDDTMLGVQTAEFAYENSPQETTGTDSACVRTFLPGRFRARMSWTALKDDGGTAMPEP
ncbi:unnamed protein product, partial [marine sediment metagenome]